MAESKIKDLLIHIGLIVLTFLLISYLFFYVYLPSQTHHGEALDVPDLKGKTLQMVEMVLNEKGLKFAIFDSTYSSDMKPLSVISQFPKAGEKVKESRTIYITISSANPPLVKMPKLVDNSLKSAEMTLRGYGLVLGQVNYMPHANKGVVLKQMTNQATILPGTMIKKGTVIDLLVSSGLGDMEVTIPNLVGMLLEEAKSSLTSRGLVVGTILYEEGSTRPSGTVLRQKPENNNNDSTNTVKTGEIVDIWVAGSKPQ